MTAKPDWEACKDRYRAWWAHEDFGRAGIQVSAPLKPILDIPHPKPPDKTEDIWLDREYICQRMDYHLTHTYFGGEAFPIWNAGYPGWDSLPVFLGCDIILKEETGWWVPFMRQGELGSYNPSDLKIDRSCKWFKLSREFRRMAIDESRDRAIPATGAFGGAGDTLAAIRSTEQLLIDIKEDPQAVLAFEIRMMEVWCEHFDERHNDFNETGQGSAGWFHLWSPGKFYAAQCDLAYNIGAEDFEQCFLPAIDMQTRFLDNTVYHVDGVNNFRHVDALCGLPRLQALQILPGAGKPSPLKYIDILRKVQKAGKNLHISIAPSEVKDALELLSSRGLMIETWAASEEEADGIIRYVERNSK